MTEQRFGKLLQNIDDAVTVVDMHGRPLWSSSVQDGDLGYESEFWRSANLFDLVHDDDRPQIEQQYLQLLQEPDEPVTGEVRLVSPDGVYHHVGYVVRNLLDDPDIAGMVITARSIEAEIAARRAREQRQRELEDALADRARFIARLSHEMRSPLHAVQGLAEVLLGSPTINAVDRRHIESIEREAVALRHMIDDLLDLSKMGAGHMELQLAPFMPASLCDTVGLTNRAQAELKGLDLRIEITPEAPRLVLGDEYRVRQILVNLISNAIKYTDSGSVTLRLDRGEGDMLRFDVTDTGRGIPAEKAEHLFEPYRQMDVADSSIGTGIGLTITKMLTELMNGTIAFESSENGTTFTCEIPLPEARRAADRAEAEVQPLAISRTLSILVVDDSEVNRALASAQVERLGHSCELAESGLDGLKKISASSYDVVFMDWHMPDLDGLETTRRARALGDSIDQPTIVAMTASVMTGDRELCLEAGMDDYLAKPVSISDLSEMIQKWTGHEAEDSSKDTSAEESAIDGSALDKLIVDLGDASIAHSIVMTFLTELKTWRHDLVEGVATGDLVTARRTAHTVKSTAAMLGAASLSAACQDFEHEATTPINANTLLETVLETADVAERELRERANAWGLDPKESQR